ncbi:peptidoglycan DD-metalloendopeptidase family protein [Nocardia tengchongensis]|uniref:peptidoglycan DD-metalloendopeptidase family protein n=1 Tax=Nocardia tengchongensis TaxID=2055889 RepID=UPI00368F28F0
MASDSSPGRSWLIVLMPIVLLGGLFAGSNSSIRTKPDPDCLPNMPSAPKPTTSQGVARWPMTEGSYTITSPFGNRDNGQGGTEFHKGADFGAALNTPIYAALDGTVVAAGPAQGFGNWIVIDSFVDDHKISTVYGHMFNEGVLVKKDQIVKAGDKIALVGQNGEASGPHLHFEVVLGGRLAGGEATDPIAWLTQHAATAPQSPSTVDPKLAAASSPAPGGEMPALAADKGSEDRLQVDTIRLIRAVALRFPQLTSIGGYGPGGGFPDHPEGRAADFMIPDPDSATGKALGDQIVDYVMGHASDFHVVYSIWQRQYRPAGGTPTLMEDRGSKTENHFDHVHVTVEGHGYPQPGQTYGRAPALAATATSATPRSGCGPPVLPASTSALKPGTVPAAFEPWVIKAAGTCGEVSAPLIAAQLENESGFTVDAHNTDSGADGPAQFIPTTWAEKAVDGDGDGTRNPRSIPDAVMSQASYDCELAADAKKALASGAVNGDLTAIWLSMYNCGPGRTLDSGGVCPNAETRPYTTNIIARARDFFTDPATVRRS